MSLVLPHNRVVHTQRGRRLQPCGAASVQAFASRTLEFLQVIERTIQSVLADTEVLRANTRDLRRLLEKLAAGGKLVELDPTGRVVDLLSQASASCVRIRERALLQRASAVSDPDLFDEVEVVDAYSDYIDAIADAHNAIEDLSDTVQTLDALHSPVVGQAFESADALIEDMLKA